MSSAYPRRGGPEHIVLLGDSIFDNAAYTSGQPDVVTHLRRLLPDGWQATLCAVDGATIGALRAQLPRIPADASRFVIAIGGNDALGNIDLLSLRVRSSGEALSMFSTRLAAFEAGYRAAMDEVARLGRSMIVCTIYNGALPGVEGELARVGLMMFNDVIVRCAAALSLDVIELRAICTEPSDYANPIEPSEPGGYKIAKAIAHATGALASNRRPARVWIGP